MPGSTPMTPEEYFVSAQRANDALAAMSTVPHTPENQRAARGIVELANLDALMAIAGFLEQQHLCGHGVRGWCPSCHLSLKEGTYTP